MTSPTVTDAGRPRAGRPEKRRARLLAAVPLLALSGCAAYAAVAGDESSAQAQIYVQSDGGRVPVEDLSCDRVAADVLAFSLPSAEATDDTDGAPPVGLTWLDRPRADTRPTRAITRALERAVTYARTEQGSKFRDAPSEGDLTEPALACRALAGFSNGTVTRVSIRLPDGLATPTARDLVVVSPDVPGVPQAWTLRRFP